MGASMRLERKVALVTGAASGIGQAVAKLFAQEGAQVAIADLNDEGGLQTLTEIGGESAGCYIKADVSNPPAVRAMVEETIARYKTIDILVNNAAIVVFKRLIDTEP